LRDYVQDRLEGKIRDAQGREVADLDRLLSSAGECQDFCVWGGFRNWLMGKFYSSSGLSQAAAGAPG
jgi:hypothetical protein